jgi:hypothetical protein
MLRPEATVPAGAAPSTPQVVDDQSQELDDLGEVREEKLADPAECGVAGGGAKQVTLVGGAAGW